MSIGDKNRIKNKSIFEAITEVSKSKNAKKRLRDLKKWIKQFIIINYKNGNEIIGFAKYMGLHKLAREIFMAALH